MGLAEKSNAFTGESAAPRTIADVPTTEQRARTTQYQYASPSGNVTYTDSRHAPAAGMEYRNGVLQPVQQDAAAQAPERGLFYTVPDGNGGWKREKATGGNADGYMARPPADADTAARNRQIERARNDFLGIINDPNTTRTPRAQAIQGLSELYQTEFGREEAKPDNSVALEAMKGGNAAELEAIKQAGASVKEFRGMSSDQRQGIIDAMTYAMPEPEAGIGGMAGGGFTNGQRALGLSLTSMIATKGGKDAMNNPFALTQAAGTVAAAIQNYPLADYGAAFAAAQAQINNPDQAAETARAWQKEQLDALYAELGITQDDSKADEKE
jgi:hypothetical protein